MRSDVYCPWFPVSPQGNGHVRGTRQDHRACEVGRPVAGRRVPKRVSRRVGEMHRGGPVGIRLEAATEHGTLDCAHCRGSDRRTTWTCSLAIARSHDRAVQVMTGPSLTSADASLRFVLGVERWSATAPRTPGEPYRAVKTGQQRTPEELYGRVVRSLKVGGEARHPAEVWPR